MNQTSDYMPILFFWLIGAAAGTLLFFAACQSDEASLLADSQIMMNAVRTGQTSGFPLFRYIFQRRFLTALVLWLLSMTQFGMAVLNSAVFCCGMTNGFAVSAMTYLYGISGYPIAVASGFPHTLIYLPVWILFYCFCRNVNRHSGGILRQSPYFLAVCVAFLAAAFLEAYLNPWILEWIGQIFNIF